jgi:hypothetical protein
MPVLRPLIVVLLLISLAWPLGIVLCFGADGHIALEPIHDRARNASASGGVRSSYQPTAKVPAGVPHPGPCMDIALFANDGAEQPIPASDPLPQLGAPVSVAELLIAQAFPALPAPSSLSYPSLPTNSPLTSLRSVVLRI